MSYVVLALKWRPQTFADVAGQKSVSLILRRALETNRTGHAYLFNGPRGVGKTSMARILAKALNCEKGPTPEPCNTCDACREITNGSCMDVLEIDGASNRGIDDIRELKETVRYAPSRYRIKVTIIDEVHMLTTDAFNALLKTLEEPPAHAMFILATTEPLKIPQTIMSRCQRFDFGRLTVAQIVQHLEKICRSEDIEMKKDALTLISRRAEGSVRDALTLLDQVAASGKGPFDERMVQSLLGLSGRSLTFDLTRRIAEKDMGGVLAKLDEAYQQGLNLQEIMEELIQHVRNLLLVSTDEKLEQLLEATEEERKHYQEQVRYFSPDDLLRIMRILMDESGRMRRSPFPRFHMELALAECATLPATEDLARILNRLGDTDPGLPPGGGERPRRVPQTRKPDSPPAGSLGDVDTPAPPMKIRDSNLIAEDDSVPPAGLDGSEFSSDPWNQVIDQVRVKKIALATCLASCRVQSFQDGELIVERKPGDIFLAQQLDVPIHKRLTQEAIKNVFGASTRCRFVEGQVESGPQAQTPDAGNSMDPVRRIARFMDGEITGPA